MTRSALHPRRRQARDSGVHTSKKQGNPLAGRQSTCEGVHHLERQVHVQGKSRTDGSGRCPWRVEGGACGAFNRGARRSRLGNIANNLYPPPRTGRFVGGSDCADASVLAAGSLGRLGGLLGLLQMPLGVLRLLTPSGCVLRVWRVVDGVSVEPSGYMLPLVRLLTSRALNVVAPFGAAPCARR